MEEQKGKLGLGKIYEKYLILKRNSHTLQIACVFDETYSNMGEMFKIGLNAIPKIKDRLEGGDE